MASSARDLSRVLGEQIQSLDELAIVLWLARHPTLTVSPSTVAKEAGVVEPVAIGALRKLVGAGLVAELSRAPGLFRCALPLPPDDLVSRLVADEIRRR